jgi:predicted enzyme related to lactoylglutathione lyase
MHGQFIWYELTTPDVDAARKFYPSFTGWDSQRFDNDYTLWTTGGSPFAGIFKLGPELAQQGVPPNWMPYIEAGDVDATATAATAAGGKVVVPPQELPGTGRFAVLADPQGATFGIYKSTATNGAQGWNGTPVVGRFSWHELMTTDHRAAEQFYRALFGWERTGEFDMGPQGGSGPDGNIYQMYGMGGKMFGGMYNRSTNMANMPPYWLCYINVKDVNRAVETAKKGGAKLLTGPMQVPGGSWVAILQDPQGAAFAVHGGASSARTAAPAGKAKRAKAKTIAKSASKAKSGSKPKTKAKAKAKPKPKAKVKAKTKTGSKAKARAKTTPRRKAKTKKRSKR